MKKKKIIIVVGTRSEVIKFSSIIRELKKNKNFDMKILHTGQHDTMSLMKSLDLPEPDFYLGESLRKKWAKVSKINSIVLAITWLLRVFFEIRKILIKERPDAVFYQGNCMTVPIVVFASKSISKKITLIHRESGIRSYNLFEPFLGDLAEKIGDLFADILFTPTKIATNNLKKERINGRIYYVGDPHFEIVKYALKKSKKKIKKKGFIVVNVVHFENITNKKKMKNLVEILIKSPFKVIFPMSENVRGKLELFGFIKEIKKYSHIEMTNSYNFIDFLLLIKQSEAVLTDSGGVQQEAMILKVPCIFLGKYNVWKEFENMGMVKSTNFDVNKTLKLLKEIKKRGDFYKKARTSKYFLWDGKATERIIKVLEKELCDK